MTFLLLSFLRKQESRRCPRENGEAENNNPGFRVKHGMTEKLIANFDTAFYLISGSRKSLKTSPM